MLKEIILCDYNHVDHNPKTDDNLLSSVAIVKKRKKVILTTKRLSWPNGPFKLELPSSSPSSSSLDTTTTTTTKNGKEEIKSKIALEHEKIESFIESFEVYCFKRNLSVKEFVDLVYRLYFIAYNKFRIPLEKLPDYVQQLEFEADTLAEQAEKKLEMKKMYYRIMMIPLLENITQIDHYLKKIKG
jgi:hypothetical protein